MRIPSIPGLLLLHLLLLCDRSAAKSYDLRSASTESETRDRVAIGGRARDERPNREPNFDKLTVNSRTAAFPCPVAADIEPCVCTNENEQITLDCSYVESQDQLEAVFRQDFPVKALQVFYMTDNSAITALGNFLNGVTFESIWLAPGPFDALEEVSEYFLFDNKDTLTSLRIGNSNITSDHFPFLILPQMEKLNLIDFQTSLLTWIPAIAAPALSSLTLAEGLTDIIEAGTFPIHEWDTEFFLNLNKISSVEPGSFFYSDENSTASSGELTINLFGNNLQSLQAGTFPLRNGHMYLYFTSNKIATIEPRTFILPEETGAARKRVLTMDFHLNELESLQAGTFPLWNGDVSLSLGSNKIATIEPGTFDLPETTDSLILTLNLYDNQLTIVDEAVFGDLMPFISSLRVDENPLICGCDVAWLVTNYDYMAKVDSRAKCDNGKALADLDPDFFGTFC